MTLPLGGVGSKEAGGPGAAGTDGSPPALSALGAFLLGTLLAAWLPITVGHCAFSRCCVTSRKRGAHVFPHEGGVLARLPRAPPEEVAAGIVSGGPGIWWLCLSAQVLVTRQVARCGLGPGSKWPSRLPAAGMNWGDTPHSPPGRRARRGILGQVVTSPASLAQGATQWVPGLPGKSQQTSFPTSGSEDGWGTLRSSELLVA